MRKDHQINLVYTDTISETNYMANQKYLLDN